MNSLLIQTEVILQKMTIEWFVSHKLRERYCRVILPGKPDIYVFPKQTSNIYAICAVKYGSLDQSYSLPDGNTVVLPEGVAHFLEHKMFVQPNGQDAFDIFASLGADANAYTSYDRTAYLFNCTSNFDQSFATLLNMVTHPYFTTESVEREQGIIKQEINMYNDDPDTVCYENMMSILYEKHPVRLNVCGTSKSIASITDKLLYDCHRIFYNPSNMVIVVCGPVNVEQVIDIVNQEQGWGGAIDFSRHICRETEPPVQNNIVQNMRVSMPLFAMGFKELEFESNPQKRHTKDMVASILERMLFSTSSELYNELYDRRLITSPFSVGRAAEADYAFTEICGTANNVEVVAEKIVSHIRKKRTTGLSLDDFERCKRRRIGDAISRFDSTEDIANGIVGYAFDGLDILKDPEIVESIRFEDVVQLFENMYCEKNMAVSYVLPIK